MASSADSGTGHCASLPWWTRSADMRRSRDLDLDSDACRLSASTRGVKRNVRYHYPRRMPSPVITEGVLLEMGIRGGPEPNAVHSFRSLAAHHGIEVVGDSPDTWAEYAPVEIAVLGAE